MSSSKQKCNPSCPGDATCEHATICVCGSPLADHGEYTGHVFVSMHEYYCSHVVEHDDPHPDPVEPTPESLDLLRRRAAIGYAVAEDGVIDVRSVCPTRIGAVVNRLGTSRGIWVRDGAGDDSIWEQWHAVARPGERVVEVSIADRENQGDFSSFQNRVHLWAERALSSTGSHVSVTQRSRRFLEEAAELVQAAGLTVDDARQIVDVVYGKPVGDLQQEAGGAAVTLAQLLTALGIQLAAAAEQELTRIEGLVDKVRAKDQMMHVRDLVIVPASDHDPATCPYCQGERGAAPCSTYVTDHQNNRLSETSEERALGDEMAAKAALAPRVSSDQASRKAAVDAILKKWDGQPNTAENRLALTRELQAFDAGADVVDLIMMRIRMLYDKLASSPLGMTDPWERRAMDGKPLLYDGKRGLLAYGTIATFDEFDLIVAVVNELPLILEALGQRSRDLPAINVTIEHRGSGIIGSRSLEVLRVEREDDGSLTVVCKWEHVP